MDRQAHDMWFWEIFLIDLSTKELEKTSCLLFPLLPSRQTFFERGQADYDVICRFQVGFVEPMKLFGV